MTGIIQKIEDGKVYIRVDNGQIFIIPVDDVDYFNPKPGDWVSLVWKENRWEASKRTGVAAEKKSKRVIIIAVAVLCAAAAGFTGVMVTRTPKKGSVKNSQAEIASVKRQTKASSRSDINKNTSSDAEVSKLQSSDSNSTPDWAHGTITVTVSTQQPAETDHTDITLETTGYYNHIPQYSKECYVYYAAVIKNPNKDLAASSPHLKVTAKDENGLILGTQTIGYGYIMPNDTIALGDTMDVGSKVPKTIEFSISADNYVPASGVNVPDSSAFSIENAAEVRIQGRTKVTGNIVYNGDKDCQGVRLVALFMKNGKIVFPAFGYLPNPEKGKEAAFEINPLIPNLPDHDSVKVFARYES